MLRLALLLALLLALVLGGVVLTAREANRGSTPGQEIGGSQARVAVSHLVDRDDVAPDERPGRSFDRLNPFDRLDQPSERALPRVRYKMCRGTEAL